MRAAHIEIPSERKHGEFLPVLASIKGSISDLKQVQRTCGKPIRTATEVRGGAIFGVDNAASREVRAVCDSHAVRAATVRGVGAVLARNWLRRCFVHLRLRCHGSGFLLAAFNATSVAVK